MFTVKNESLSGEGCKIGGNEHVSEVAELIRKDRFYGKLLASWISVCIMSIVSPTFVDVFVNAVNQMAGKF